MIRRSLLGACAVLLLWAAPAAAAYEDVLGEGQERTPTVVVAGESRPSPVGGLARTGSDSVVPLAGTATALVGGGALLVLAARRRRSTPRNAAA